MEQEIAEGRYLDIPNMRFTSWIDRWISINTSRLAPSTLVTYHVYIKKHYKPFFARRKISQINHIILQEFMSLKMETLSSTYVRKMMFVLSEILEDAMPGKNPMRHVDLPLKDKFLPHLITEAEFSQLLEASKGYFVLVLLLSGWCGLRRGEIAALQWNDINWTDHTIRVDENLAITMDNTYQAKTTKSSAGVRTVAAPAVLIEKLDSYRKSQGRVGGRIFNVRPDSLSQTFVRLRDRLGLSSDIRFHDLRHYHASWLYKNKIPDQYAAQRLGHDIHVLKSIYQHLGMDVQLELDDKIKKMR
jgi:integrase